MKLFLNYFKEAKIIQKKDKELAKEVEDEKKRKREEKMKIAMNFNDENKRLIEKKMLERQQDKVEDIKVGILQ